MGYLEELQYIRFDYSLLEENADYDFIYDHRFIRRLLREMEKDYSLQENKSIAFEKWELIVLNRHLKNGNYNIRYDQHKYNLNYYQIPINNAVVQIHTFSRKEYKEYVESGYLNINHYFFKFIKIENSIIWFYIHDNKKFLLYLKDPLPFRIPNCLRFSDGLYVSTKQEYTDLQTELVNNLNQKFFIEDKAIWPPFDIINHISWRLCYNNQVYEDISERVYFIYNNKKYYILDTHIIDNEYLKELIKDDIYFELNAIPSTCKIDEYGYYKKVVRLTFYKKRLNNITIQPKWYDAVQGILIDSDKMINFFKWDI